MIKKSWNIDKPIEFIYESNRYLIEGKGYWRITRIKSVVNQPGLNAWRAKVGNKKANEIMKKRGDFGSKFHKLSEIILGGANVNAAGYKDDELTETLDLFKAFIKKYNIRCESSEQALWDDTLEIGGTTDFIGYADLSELGKNVHVIGDWKTSTGIYKDYWLQLAAYVWMFEQMTGVKLDGAFIAQFRDGKTNFEEKTYDELMKYFEVFKHCIALFKYTKGEF